jgi:hypothetical protein
MYSFFSLSRFLSASQPFWQVLKRFDQFSVWLESGSGAGEPAQKKTM